MDNRQHSADDNSETGFHIYNVTIKVDHKIHEPWVEWMKNSHIPDVMNTGCFVRYRLVRLLETDESDGITYAIQYYTKDRAAYESYINRFAPSLQQQEYSKWGRQVVQFHSLMEVVH